MKRARFALAALTAAASLTVCGSGVAGDARPRKIVIVAMPAVAWEDVAAGYAPNLRSLGEEWSLAAMSIRTVGPRTDEASGLATLSAGNRARGLGVDNVEFVPVTVPHGEGALTVLRMEDLRRDNRDRLHYGAVPGELGDALRGGGLRTGVVGNSDGGAVPVEATLREPSRFEKRRLAGLALADARGVIDSGSVGDELVIRDPRTANGFRTNSVELLGSLRQTLRRADVILVELADTVREGLVLYATVADGPPAPETNAPLRVAAVTRDDELLGLILQEIDLERDSVFVLGLSGIGPAHPENLTIALTAGVGSRRGGWLTSATTQREGLVTLADVAPGILNVLDIEPPKEMTGQAIRPVAAESTDRLDRLLKVQAAALFHHRWLSVFFAALVLVQAILYLVAWRPAARQPGGRANVVLRAAALGFLSVPVATFVWHRFSPERLGVGALPLLVALCLMGAAISLTGSWRTKPSGPGAIVCVLTASVIGISLALGGKLQISGFIGYSPIVAGRFYGLGNLDFAVFGTSVILAASASAAFFPRRAVLLASALGVTAAILSGAPFFGADFGGLVSVVIGFGILIPLLDGRRLSWRWAGVLALGALAVGFLAGFIDSLRPVEVQTHLGRFVTRLIDAGPSAVSEIIVRKATANWAVATTSILSLSVPVAGLFLFLLLRRPRGRLQVALRTDPGLRAGMVAAAALNVAGFVVNDSGIAVPAMGLAVAVPYCLAAILATSLGPAPTLEPDDLGQA